MDPKIVESIKGVLTWLNETWPTIPLEDLPLGQIHNTNTCPIAKALYIKTGIPYKVLPSAYIHESDRGDILSDTRLPDCAKTFISHFDSGQIPDLEDKR